jgi:hypothetical protein
MEPFGLGLLSCEAESNIATETILLKRAGSHSVEAEYEVPK